MNKEIEKKNHLPKNTPVTRHPSRFTSRAGFTLIELMVASSIFIIVMVISIGAVLSVVDANRKAQSLNDVMTNLNFAIESMTRDLREGSNYSVFNNNFTSVSFKDSQARTVTYAFSSSDHSILKTVDDGSGNGPSSITSTGVIINSLNFEVLAPASTQQPVILITLQGKAGVNLKTQSDFKIQTLVTQRVLGPQP